MRYLVVGAGGTGGALAAHLVKGGQDVTLIARGAHLEAIRARGLELKIDREHFLAKLPAFTMEEYEEKRRSGAEPAPGAVLVCVKGYSLPETAAFLQKVVGDDTVVIPILNIYGTGGRLQEKLPGTVVTDGCIYIAGQKESPGVIRMSGPLLRVVYGLRQDASPELRERVRPLLEEIRADLVASDIKTVLSEKIESDAFRKYTLISPMATLGAALGTSARDMQPGGAHRETFVKLVRELMALAGAQSIELPDDMAEKNLDIMDHMTPDTTASMQRDVAAGNSSEVDGLVYEVVRQAHSLGVPVPEYERLAGMLRERGLK